MAIRRIVGVTALAIAAPLAVGSAPALAADNASITVRASDSTPASGQQFIVRGRFFMDGDPADGHIVRVQTYRNGAWSNIRGAHVTTNDEGRYRVRVILSQKGLRQMRVVGVTGEQRNEFKRFDVRVH